MASVRSGLRLIAWLMPLSLVMGSLTTIGVAWVPVLCGAPKTRSVTLYTQHTKAAGKYGFERGWDLTLAEAHGRFGCRRAWFAQPRGATCGNPYMSFVWPFTSSTNQPVHSTAQPREWGRYPAFASAFLTNPDLMFAGHHRAEDGRGWPRIAFWCPIQEWPRRADGGIELGGNGPRDTIVTYRVMPFRPIWSALAFNGRFFAAAWMPLFLLPISVRRRRRRRLGHCPCCNYDLAGSGGLANGCPECGWMRT